MRLRILLALVALVWGCSDDAAEGGPGLKAGMVGGGADGKLSDLDGSADHPDGADDAPLEGGSTTPDGQVTDPDWEVEPAADGGSGTPDGQIVLPDGTVDPGPDAVEPEPDVQKVDVPPDCVPAAEVCNGADDDCDGFVDEGVLCNDANPCSADVCAGANGCQHGPAPVGTGCDLDGSLCTADTCQGTQCVPGGQKNCSDGNPCTTDACNGGLCSHVVSPGAPCEDGNACSVGDTCLGLQCQPGVPKACNDGNPCTLDGCDLAGGGCVFEPFVLGVACNDGSKCTYGDTCKGGKCLGKPLPCDDGQPCTDDVCDPGAGCQHPSVDGLPCDDGLPCTKDDQCKGGKCTAIAFTCDDGNPCTVDTCGPVASPGGGAPCLHSLDAGACDDGNACSTGDSCASGQCIGKLAACDDGNPCTVDSCDKVNGCSHVDEKAACNDGNVCTVGDSCAGGTCVAGQPVNCNDGVPCTVDACDPKNGGCSHAPDAKLCDDGDVCTFDACLTASGCKHDTIPQCCGGKPCAAGEICIAYPDTLAPFCAKPCNTGNDCPGSCCYMTWKTKHCLTNVYKAECCNTPEYWATETNPYGCGVGGKGLCVNYPNKQKPWYPSDVMKCDLPCNVNADCPGTCCGGTTLGDHLCVAKGYEFLCPNF